MPFSLSGFQSTPYVDNGKFPPGRSTYVDVLAKVFYNASYGVFMKRCVLLQNGAHWCMTIDISGRVYR